MKLHVFAITVIFFTVFSISKCDDEKCKANEDKDWYYDNDLSNGPDHWGDDNPDCKGEKQSPIDIQTSDVEKMEDSEGLQLKDYDKIISQVSIENLGYTIKIQPKDDIERSVLYNGVPYYLKAINLRWGNKSTDDDGDSTSTPGSEHKIDGQQYAMEMQLVHENENKSSVVIGVLFDISDDSNPTIDALQNPIDKYKYQGDKYEGDMDEDYSATLNLTEIVKNGSSYYQYDGSLTQPPCTENVTWLILQNPSSVSTAQVLKFEDLYSVSNTDSTDVSIACHIVNNDRETQPLSDRTVYSG